MVTGYKILGLIGYPLGHSFSAAYFSEKFQRERIEDFQYLNFPIADISSLTELIRTTPGLIGLNVTIPHKQAVIPYLDEIEENARVIGAVNVIKVLRDAGKIRLMGFNTDLLGIRECLNIWNLPVDLRALVFGTGGSSKAVCRELEIRKINYNLVSRNPTGKQIGYSDVTEGLIEDSKLLINCTPLGMYPETGNKPDIPYQGITNKHFLFDLIYNPDTTMFMQEGINRGASVQGGLRMLHTQAEASWNIWMNVNQP